MSSPDHLNMIRNDRIHIVSVCSYLFFILLHGVGTAAFFGGISASPSRRPFLCPIPSLSSSSSRSSRSSSGNSNTAETPTERSSETATLERQVQQRRQRMQDLCSLVAKTDPEWVETYVLNTVPVEILPQLKTTLEQAKKECKEQHRIIAQNKEKNSALEEARKILEETSNEKKPNDASKAAVESQDDTQDNNDDNNYKLSDGSKELLQALDGSLPIESFENKVVLEASSSNSSCNALNEQPQVNKTTADPVKQPTKEIKKNAPEGVSATALTQVSSTVEPLQLDSDDDNEERKAATNASEMTEEDAIFSPDPKIDLLARNTTGSSNRATTIATTRGANVPSAGQSPSSSSPFADTTKPVSAEPEPMDASVADMLQTVNDLNLQNQSFKEEEEEEQQQPESSSTFQPESTRKEERPTTGTESIVDEELNENTGTLGDSSETLKGLDGKMETTKAKNIPAGLESVREMANQSLPLDPIIRSDSDRVEVVPKNTLEEKASLTTNSTAETNSRAEKFVTTATEESQPASLPKKESNVERSATDSSVPTRDSKKDKPDSSVGKPPTTLVSPTKVSTREDKSLAAVSVDSPKTTKVETGTKKGTSTDCQNKGTASSASLLVSKEVSANASERQSFMQPRKEDVAKMATEEFAEDAVVLFRETGAKDFTSHPLSLLKKLGYSSRDVSSIDPDALALIIKEDLPRPRSGIPDRWKPSAKTVRVRIIPKEEAQELLRPKKGERSDLGSDQQSVGKKDASGGTIPSTKENRPVVTEKNRERSLDREVDVEGRDAPLRSKPRERLSSVPKPVDIRDFVDPVKDMDDESDVEGRPRVKRPSPRDGDDPNSASRRRKEEFREKRRRQRAAEAGRKIYSGRPATQKTKKGQQRDDPPPPPAFWPDIDSFRSMLRDEASLRLRILGEDFADSVKDESDWRLGLYKDWLWTLHNGVGTPIVESRSDRMRRLERESAKKAKHKAPPARPSRRKKPPKRQ